MGRLARATRIGDTERGICFGCSPPACPNPRRGKVSEGSHNVFVEGIGVARAGDAGECLCHHGSQFTIMDGSSNVFVNGRPAACVKGLTLCQNCAMPGSIVDGASTVFFG